MKRSKKICYTVCLTLLGLVVPLSLISLDANALKHEYKGIQLKSQEISFPHYNSDTGKREFDWSNASETTNVGGGFKIEFKGDALTEYESDITLNHSYTDILSTYSNNECSYSDKYSEFNISNESNSYRIITTSYARGYPVASSHFNSNVDSTWVKCRSRSQFGSDNNASFNNNSLPSTLFICDFNTNGCLGSGNRGTKAYLQQNVLPYPYTSDGFYTHSTAISSKGVHYSHTFSFKDLFNKEIHKFSYLKIPLGTFDDYFYNPDNLFEGRHFDFKGTFTFDDDSFALHSDMSENAYFQVQFSGLSLTTTGTNQASFSANCSLTRTYMSDPDNTHTVMNLDYSCPVDLPTSFIFLTPSLVISGDNNYFFTTNSDWRFASVFVVTDYDDTPGQDFNSDLTGNYIPGDAKNDIEEEGDADWFSSLINLFHFGFLNPFAPIFAMFTNQESCAEIPILSDMLHSEESQVCPFFSSSTRSVLTPVFSLASMMLIFGFAVRWLGARSGNLFEDTTGDHSFGIGRRGKKE